MLYFLVNVKICYSGKLYILRLLFQISNKKCKKLEDFWSERLAFFKVFKLHDNLITTWKFIAEKAEQNGCCQGHHLKQNMSIQFGGSSKQFYLLEPKKMDRCHTFCWLTRNVVIKQREERWKLDPHDKAQTFNNLFQIL